MTEILNAREQIAAADRQLAAAFAARMAAMREVAAYKQAHGLPVLDAQQEQAVLARNAALVEDPEIRAYYLNFIRDAMTYARQYQRRLIEGGKVAFCGVEGAFAHIAARRIFPDQTPVPYDSFKAAYDAAVSGESDCAVLPIENSYAGEVGQVIDLLFNGDLFINGVFALPIAQQLLVLPGTKRSEIKTVISHPQALSQCAAYIKENGFAQQTAVNTAVAAQMVSERGDRSLAAIASAETASLYGLEVLDRKIHASDANATRFAVFSREPHHPSGAHSFLLLFTVHDSAGALARAINVVGAHGFNMTALRSRPMHALPFHYYFYVEAQGDEQSDAGQAMLAELQQHCDRLKVAGSFTETVLS
ncbi:MAG: chorismate mutase [Clostridia bacterium]|nr:chorismate mutase [Clostridia bacterium]